MIEVNFDKIPSKDEVFVKNNKKYKGEKEMSKKQELIEVNTDNYFRNNIFSKYN